MTYHGCCGICSQSRPNDYPWFDFHYLFGYLWLLMAFLRWFPYPFPSFLFRFKIDVLRILVLTLVLQIYLMASLKALVTSVAVNEIRDVYDRYQITMSLGASRVWIKEDQRSGRYTESLWFQNVLECFSKSTCRSCGNPLWIDALFWAAVSRWWQSCCTCRYGNDTSRMAVTVSCSACFIIFLDGNCVATSTGSNSSPTSMNMMVLACPNHVSCVGGKWSQISGIWWFFRAQPRRNKQKNWFDAAVLVR